MKLRNWIEDVWLTIRYGKYRVVRWEGSYYVCHKQTACKVLCDSKRCAEGECAIRNDLRGT